MRWHCKNGASSLDNGLALCVLHHKALDLAVIGLTEERRVLVSSHAVGGDAVREQISRYGGGSCAGRGQAGRGRSRGGLRGEHRLAPEACVQGAGGGGGVGVGGGRIHYPGTAGVRSLVDAVGAEVRECRRR